ncbi:MAG: alpha-1,2-fucosyltransferase [Thiobacillus sp.]
MSAIILQVIGGLGNQMFQYAAGRALSILRGVPLHLDVSGFTGYGLHQGFELEHVFSCPVTLAEPQEVRAFLGWQSSRLARRIFARPALRFLRNRHFMVEPHFHYWPGICNVPLPTYLMGYWQSERYFADVAQTIRTDFTFRQPMTGRNHELAEEIGAVNAVSLHVRRGDYANNLRTKATHGVCPLDYYEAAIRYIAERVEAPHYFVFSDDMEWVRANLRSQFPCSYVDHNQGAESYNDMRLMSLCKHHIIANSSFSWWGAWLNPRDDKVVVAPKNWFANNNDTKDLLPFGWATL